MRSDGLHILLAWNPRRTVLAPSPRRNVQSQHPRPLPWPVAGGGVGRAGGGGLRLPGFASRSRSGSSRVRLRGHPGGQDRHLPRPPVRRNRAYGGSRSGREWRGAGRSRMLPGVSGCVAGERGIAVPNLQSTHRRYGRASHRRDHLGTHGRAGIPPSPGPRPSAGRDGLRPASSHFAHIAFSASPPHDPRRSRLITAWRTSS